MAWFITLGTSESQNPGGNTSTVSATLYLNWNNADRYSGFNTSGTINIGGNVLSFTGPTSGGSAAQTGSSVLASHSVTFTHDANGYRGAVGTSGSFDAAGTSTIAPQNLSTSGTTFGAIDYDRRPGSPSISASRNVDAVTVSLGSVSSPAGTPTYYVERSENSGAWGDQRTGQSVTYAGLTRGSSQQFRTFASNSDGSSGLTFSSAISIPNVPSAPASIAATQPSGLSSTISVGSSTNGGASITGYFVQASPDDGATWLPAQAMTNQSFTFTNLIPGATYKFRAYAVNEMGSGAFAITPSTFVPAGGKRWTGSNWLPTQVAKRWNGSAWVDLRTAKRWNGSTWVDLS